MAKTKQQVIDRALQELGVLPLGQNATAEWSSTMSDAYDEVFAALELKGLVSWGGTDSVPDEYVKPVSVLMAAQRINIAGVSNDRASRIAVEASGAIDELREINAGAFQNISEVSDF